MFYYIFQTIQDYDIPGARLVDYITFRAGVSFTLAMLIALIFGRNIIGRLQRLQIGEEIRNLGLEGQMSKKGTPTMGA